MNPKSGFDAQPEAPTVYDPVVQWQTWDIFIVVRHNQLQIVKFQRPV
jgi:hypothetical protein